MGGNNDFFENFERNKYLKKLPSMQRVKIKLFRSDHSVNEILTLSQPGTTKVPYANSLDPDETPSNLTSHPDPRCLAFRQHLYKLRVTLKHFEY